MHAGSIAHLLLCSAVKSWRLTNPRTFDKNFAVDDDFIPYQEVDFTLFDTPEPSEDFTSQIAGLASIKALEAQLDLARPLDQYWRVPIYDIYLNNEEDAIGSIKVNTSNLPPQLSEGDLGGDTGEVDTPPPASVDKTFDLIGNDADLTATAPPRKDYYKIHQHFTATTRLGSTAVLRLINQSLLKPFSKRWDGAIADEYQAGEQIPGGTEPTGETMVIDVLKVDIGGRAVRWLELEELLRISIVEPSIRHSWYSYEMTIAWVTDGKVGEDLLKVAVFKGRRPVFDANGVEVPLIDTGVVKPFETQ